MRYFFEGDEVQITQGPNIGQHGVVKGKYFNERCDEPCCDGRYHVVDMLGIDRVYDKSELSLIISCKKI